MVIKFDTVGSGTYDFLLVIRSNYRPVSYSVHNKVKRRFWLKNANLSLPVFLPHWPYVIVGNLKRCFMSSIKPKWWPYHAMKSLMTFNRVDTIPRDGQTDGRICIS